MASGQPPSEGWRPDGETCVLARTSWLFGVSGEHTPSRRISCLVVPAPIMPCFTPTCLLARMVVMTQPKQPFWDCPRVLVDKAVVKSSLSSLSQSASFLATSSPYSGDWLFVLPITSCGLRLHDEVVRTAVALRLDLPLFVPHHAIAAHWLTDIASTALSVNEPLARHRAMSDLIAQAFASSQSQKNLKVCRSQTGSNRLFVVNSMASVQSLRWDITVGRTIRPCDSAGCRRCS